MEDETARVVLKGVQPYDGEYELDMERGFSTWEWRFIKSISRYLPMTIRDGFVGLDPDIYVAMAVIALFRAGRIDKTDWEHAADVLADAPFQAEGGPITVVFPEANEPPLALTGEPEPRSNPSSPESQPSSGDSSAKSSGNQDGTQQPIGTTESDMWPMLDPRTSDISPLPTSSPA